MRRCLSPNGMSPTRSNPPWQWGERGCADGADDVGIALMTSDSRLRVDPSPTVSMTAVPPPTWVGGWGELGVRNGERWVGGWREMGGRMGRDGCEEWGEMGVRMGRAGCEDGELGVRMESWV